MEHLDKHIFEKHEKQYEELREKSKSKENRGFKSLENKINQELKLIHHFKCLLKI